MRRRRKRAFSAGTLCFLLLALACLPYLVSAVQCGGACSTSGNCDPHTGCGMCGNVSGLCVSDGSCGGYCTRSSECSHSCPVCDSNKCREVCGSSCSSASECGGGSGCDQCIANICQAGGCGSVCHVNSDCVGQGDCTHCLAGICSSTCDGKCSSHTDCNGAASGCGFCNASGICAPGVCGSACTPGDNNQCLGVPECSQCGATGVCAPGKPCGCGCVVDSDCDQLGFCPHCMDGVCGGKPLESCSPCGMYNTSGCLNCSSNPLCLWCESTHTCVEGTHKKGPFFDKCSSYVANFTSCPSEKHKHKKKKPSAFPILYDILIGLAGLVFLGGVGAALYVYYRRDDDGSGNNNSRRASYTAINGEQIEPLSPTTQLLPAIRPPPPAHPPPNWDLARRPSEYGALNSSGGAAALPKAQPPQPSTSPTTRPVINRN